MDVGTKTHRPPHTGGDPEFWGRMDVTLRSTVAWEGDQLVSRMYMRAEQFDDDHTTVETRANAPAEPTGYVLPPGWSFVRIVTPATDELQYRGDSTWEDDTFERGGGLVKRYVVVGDTGGAEAGTRTQMTAYFNPVRVRIRRSEGCVP